MLATKKYFRHDFDLHENNKICNISQENFFEMYGFYILLLEVVGKKTSGDYSKCATIYDNDFFYAFNMRNDRLDRILKKLEKNNLIELQQYSHVTYRGERTFYKVQILNPKNEIFL